jgi:SAM-dependent methyltransferase
MNGPGLDRLAEEWHDLPFPDTPARSYALGMHRRPLDYYVRRVRKLGLRGKSVLDAGSGTGTWSFALRESFDDVLGVDRNEPRVDLARWIAERVGSDVRFEYGDVTALKAPDRSFDTVICYGVVISYLAPAVVLKELRRVLKPGGTLYLCINGLGWSMYLRDKRGATDEKAADMGRAGIYHTLCTRIDATRATLARGDKRLRKLAQRHEGDGRRLVEVIDAALGVAHGTNGLAPTGRLIGHECGPEYEQQFAADVAALALGKSDRFSHDRSGCGYDAPQIGAIAESVGFEDFRWAEEGRLIGLDPDDDVDIDVDPIFAGWFNGHQQVWECVLRRRG